MTRPTRSFIPFAQAVPRNLSLSLFENSQQQTLGSLCPTSLHVPITSRLTFLLVTNLRNCNLDDAVCTLECGHECMGKVQAVFV